MMIYCVIPRELEAELYDKMVEYYKDNPNVEVIVDRRDGPDRRQGQETEAERNQRVLRDRRRSPCERHLPEHGRSLRRVVGRVSAVTAT